MLWTPDRGPHDTAGAGGAGDQPSHGPPEGGRPILVPGDAAEAWGPLGVREEPVIRRYPKAFPVPEAELRAELARLVDRLVAAKYRVSRWVVARWRARLGVQAKATLRHSDRQPLRERLVLLLGRVPTGRTAVALARQLGCSRQNVHQALTRLVRQGYVARAPARRGRAPHVYSVTARGQAYCMVHASDVCVPGPA